jgi:serine/threonine protein kinase
VRFTWYVSCWFSLPWRNCITNIGFPQKGVWQGTAVAVKKLPAHKVTDEFLREFAREAKIMKSLRHPNVIQFLGACTDPPDICIITEYMNLGSLYNLIHDKTVQVRLLHSRAPK